MPSTPLELLVIGFGWPAIIASITLVLVGIIRRRSSVALAGAFLACPFLLYLFGTPRIGWLSPMVGAFYFGSSYAIAKSRTWLALAMATTFLLLVGFVATLVLSQ